ncbi:phytoene desaturase family protein [Streptomyces litchfieldiae]|uniref:NAD(P)/FAD-dependent oxidoreductase n=1 Tax=Streptomyces litchfieldiae TaxID=3075543 RepID=A0ABU2MY08_9ACTN|nr:NAD(P)/FAD-dependent oxidoreductase [Streptomyces sp. DSM 44938]MDT0346535.1 NAD(P)/FAD-dependent oxidoreductase [Streptomyces sp. DSM 44938]
MARIVVVGAGMGAMGAAARLARARHRVTVVERGDTYGGAVGRWERDGFVFDTGPGLLHFPAVWRDLYIKTGRRELAEAVDLTRVDPAVEHRFADGTAVLLPAALGGARQALDTALGAGAGDRWAALLGRARQVWEATRRPLLEEPLTGPEQRGELAALEPFPARRQGLLRRRAPATLAELAAEELRDPRLAALLTGVVQDYGLDPVRAPASAAILAYAEQTFGTWYPAGGMRALADAVYKRCLDRGVEFVFGASAARVLARDGRAAGVELADGTRYLADTVVWGAAGMGQPPSGSSRFSLLLALRGARPDGTPHRTLVHADGLTVSVLRPGDPALCPDGAHETAVLSALVPAQGQGTVDWAAPDAAADGADRLLAAADAAGLGLGERVLWREARTPLDIEGATGVPGGVIPGPALAGLGGAFLAAANTGRLPGAYRVGALAHPGGGLAHAGMSGTLAAGLINEGPDWRGSY